MRKGAITRDAVLKAIAEYDELGRARFLAKYRFSEARSYLLLHEGREYDSKAVAGVAHRWDQGRALLPEEFSGGKEHAAAWLKRAGFEVKSAKNPDWTRDEIILTCHLVMTNGWKGLDANDPRVIELSGLLQLMPIHAEADRNERFRNPNGVARKTFDIATRHPDYQGKPTNGGALDAEVLHEFLNRPAEMTEAAQLIRQGVTAGDLQTLTLDDDEDVDDYSAPEGRLPMSRHRRRGRNKGLREKKIAAVLKQGGTLACEACGFDFDFDFDFDFEEVYGDRGSGYIECHHVVPLHEAGEGRTKLSDLTLICANCHRMIHRCAPWPTPKELRHLIQTRTGRGGVHPRPAEREGHPLCHGRGMTALAGSSNGPPKRARHRPQIAGSASDIFHRTMSPGAYTTFIQLSVSTENPTQGPNWVSVGRNEG